jgi:hypothetical protein
VEEAHGVRLPPGPPSPWATRPADSALPSGGQEVHNRLMIKAILTFIGVVIALLLLASVFGAWIGSGELTIILLIALTAAVVVVVRQRKTA